MSDKQCAPCRNHHAPNAHAAEPPSRHATVGTTQNECMEICNYLYLARNSAWNAEYFASAFSILAVGSVQTNGEPNQLNSTLESTQLN